MKSDLQLIADVLRRHGLTDIADDIEDAATGRDIAQDIVEGAAYNSIHDTYGTGE